MDRRPPRESQGSNAKPGNGKPSLNSVSWKPHKVTISPVIYWQINCDLLAKEKDQSWFCYSVIKNCFSLAVKIFVLFLVTLGPCYPLPHYFMITVCQVHFLMRVLVLGVSHSWEHNFNIFLTQSKIMILLGDTWVFFALLYGDKNVTGNMNWFFFFIGNEWITTTYLVQN